MQTMSVLPIKLHWYIFSYGHIHNSINWTAEIYECVDGRDLTMQVIYYWGTLPDCSMQLTESHISIEDIYSIFANKIAKHIPIYKDQRHILAPIFISQSNEWHIAVVFLLDKSEESEKLFRRLHKLYNATMQSVITLVNIKGRTIIKFNKYETIPQQVWKIGPFKMRVHHILQGIIPYLPRITIKHRTTLTMLDQFAFFKAAKYS